MCWIVLQETMEWHMCCGSNAFWSWEMRVRVPYLGSSSKHTCMSVLFGRIPSLYVCMERPALRRLKKNNILKVRRDDVIINSLCVLGRTQREYFSSEMKSLNVFGFEYSLWDHLNAFVWMYVFDLFGDEDKQKQQKCLIELLIVFGSVSISG